MEKCDYGVSEEDLVEGKSYLVEINDCCVIGEFTAKLLRKKIGFDDGSNDSAVDRLFFDNGVMLSCFIGCKFVEKGE